MKALPLVSPAL